MAKGKKTEGEEQSGQKPAQQQGQKPQNKPGNEEPLDPNALWDKYKNLVIGVALVLAAAGVGAYYYFSTKAENTEKGHREMWAAQRYFENDSLRKAMEGDGNLTAGFQKVASDYGGTRPGNLAKFYLGASYMKQGQFEDAIANLKKFEADDILLQGRAWALIGDAHMELERYAEAENWYKKAADYKTNKQFSPNYLLKKGLAQEKQDKLKEALSTYRRIIREFPQAQEVNRAKKFKGYLLSKMQGKGTPEKEPETVDPDSLQQNQQQRGRRPGGLPEGVQLNPQGGGAQPQGGGGGRRLKVKPQQ